MRKRDKYQDIIDNAFRFIKYRCGYCGKKKRGNKNFCSMKCKTLYFEKMNKIKNGTQISKKKQSKCHVKVSANILSEEYLKQIVEKAEKNIDVRMNKLKK